MSDKQHHDKKREIVFDQQYANLELQKSTPGACIYSYEITFTDEFEHIFESNVPIIFAFLVAAIFVIMALTFFWYDTVVTRRNAKVMGAALRSNAIVSSLFPSNVRKRLYASPNESSSNPKQVASSTKLRHFMNKHGTSDAAAGANGDGIILDSKPIADLFPETTVMFCDIGTCPYLMYQYLLPLVLLSKRATLCFPIFQPALQLGVVFANRLMYSRCWKLSTRLLIGKNYEE